MKPRPRTATAKVEEAIGALRTLDRNFQQLRVAARVACHEGDVEGAIRNYCEDFGFDQVDPVKRIDVLKHALNVVDQNS